MPLLLRPSLQEPMIRNQIVCRACKHPPTPIRPSAVRGALLPCHAAPAGLHHAGLRSGPGALRMPCTLLPLASVLASQFCELLPASGRPPVLGMPQLAPWHPCAGCVCTHRRPDGALPQQASACGCSSGAPMHAAPQVEMLKSSGAGGCSGACPLLTASPCFFAEPTSWRQAASFGASWPSALPLPTLSSQ